MANDWFYLSGEEQVGPYPGEQLHELIASGHIQRETHIWTEGMPEWLPAQQIENLFPAAEEVAAPIAETAPAAQPMLVTGAPATAPTAAATANPYLNTPAAVTAAAPHEQVERNYPPVSVKKVSYPLFLWAGAIIPVIAGILVTATGLMLPEEIDFESDKYNGLIYTGLTALAIGCISAIIGGIYFYIILFRAWHILQPSGMAAMTPGKAVGFYFIPFFAYFWGFFALKGLADNWNNVMSSFTDTQAVPRFNSGILLAFCICILVFPYICPILLAVAAIDICKGINFMASRALKVGLSSSTGGGLQLY